jgi:hypothetical protein
MTSEEPEDPIEEAKRALGRALTQFPWHLGTNAKKCEGYALEIVNVLHRDLLEPGGDVPLSNLDAMLGEFYLPDDT